MRQSNAQEFSSQNRGGGELHRCLSTFESHEICISHANLVSSLKFSQMADGVFLGRELGAGVQAKVFDLVHTDGSSLGKVLKIGHSNLGHKLFLSQVASSMMDLQHEWELGMQLKAALEQQDGTLPGFTRTCDCMVVQGAENNATFPGLIMERINGWPISKRVNDPAFHNIHYIREMLFQVFSALDRAQRTLGFNHADLGLGNVMEHYPRLFPEVQKEDRQANAEALASAANPPPHCTIPGTPMLPGRRSNWSRSQVGFGCAAPPPIAGFSCDSDGGLNPLGPHVEFKIIDYGVGEFNEVLAQAAGGHEPEETLRNIQEVFAEKGISIGSESKKRMIDVVQTTPSCKLHKWKLCPFKNSSGNRFRAVADVTSTMPRLSAIKTAAPNRGPVERMYRHFWERKGDVFHLLLALALALDDRVWPKEDARDVQLFISLVHHVTGVKIKASFASKDDPKRIRVMGQLRKKRADAKEASALQGENIFGARVRCFTALRRTRMIMGAHLTPFNSGLLAGEALVSPFFGIKGAPHAELPVCVEAAFPFRPADEV